MADNPNAAQAPEIPQGQAEPPKPSTAAQAPAEATNSPGAEGAQDQPEAKGAAGATPSGSTPPAPEGETAPAGNSSKSATGAVEGKAKEDWRDKRIKQLTAKLAGAKASPPAQAPGPAAPAGGLSPEDQEAEINRRAELRAQANQFSMDCNAAVARGREAFGPEFDSRIAGLQAGITDPNDPADVGRYNALLQQGIEAGGLEHVIHALGENPEEAERVMRLPLAKMSMEVARIVDRAEQAKARSAGQGGNSLAPGQSAAGAPLPDPIKPVDGRSGQHIAIDPADASRADKLSTAEWMKRRNEQVARNDPRRFGR